MYFSDGCHACACVFVCICMLMHMCVGIYICAFFCSECYMHFTGVLGTSAWAGVYVTQEYFYTNVHICEHTRCRLCTYVYMHVCVCMHAYAYGCVCASMILLDTLRRCSCDFLSASADYNHSERDKVNRRVGGSWIQITNVCSITSIAADQ